MLYVLSGLSSLVSLCCLLYVIFKMFEEEGFLHAFLGFCCCQLYAYLWGWLKLDESVKMKVMLTWTLSIIVSAFASFGIQRDLQQQMLKMQQSEQSYEAEDTSAEGQWEGPPDSRSGAGAPQYPDAQSMRRQAMREMEGAGYDSGQTNNASQQDQLREASGSESDEP